MPKIRSVPSGVSVNLSNPRSEVWTVAYGLFSVSLRLGWLVTSRVLPALSRNSVTRMCPVVDTVTGKPQASLRSGSRIGVPSKRMVSSSTITGFTACAGEISNAAASSPPKTERMILRIATPDCLQDSRNCTGW